MTLNPDSSPVQKVLGLKTDGLDIVCSGLELESSTGSADWEKLVVKSGGPNL